MVAKPTLSREYVFIPLAALNVDTGSLSLTRVAFKDAGVEPEEGDWVDATIDGDRLAVLVGPQRGDSVTSEDLAAQSWQVWCEVAATGSDERVVRVAGVLDITATGL